MRFSNARALAAKTVPAVTIAALLSVAYMAGGTSRGARIFEELRQESLICDPDMPGLREDLRFLLARTRFKAEPNINGRPSDDLVTFAFFC